MLNCTQDFRFRGFVLLFEDFRLYCTQWFRYKGVVLLFEDFMVKVRGWGLDAAPQ